MSLFRRKERDRRINRDNGVQIPVYGPHDTLCAQDYKLPYLLANFEQNFEQRCKQWLKNADPDMFNRGYMDLLIDQLEREALVMLDNQEVDHQSVIFELAKIWIGDQIRAETKLAGVLEEESNIECEIKRLESIYYKGTAYEFCGRSTVLVKEEDVNA